MVILPTRLCFLYHIGQNNFAKKKNQTSFRGGKNSNFSTIYFAFFLGGVKTVTFQLFILQFFDEKKKTINYERK
jgi:hypothetical protein